MEFVAGPVVVHFDPGEVDALVYTRSTAGVWETARLQEPGEVITALGLDVAVALAALYDGVPVVRIPSE